MIVKRIAVACALVAAAALSGDAIADSRGGDLSPVAAFDGIHDGDARSAAIFDEVAKVFSHPRCLNCHPRSDAPMQGDAMRPHAPPVARGPRGFGEPGMACASCHMPRNVAYLGAEGSIPGGPKWHLAPRSAGWTGFSSGEICAQLHDRRRNGGFDLDGIRRHLATDPLVAWAWAPGKGRTPAPGSLDTFLALVDAWIETGGQCPE